MSCPLKITEHIAIIVKMAGNKREYTKVSMLKTDSIHHVHIFLSFTAPYKFMYLVLEQLKFGALSTILSY